MKIGFVGVGIVFFAFVGKADAKFARGESVPVERLVKNLTSYVQENPQDPHGYYVLGRVHSLAFVNKSGKLNVLPTKSVDKALPILADSQKRVKRKYRLRTEALRQHLSSAIQNYRVAIEKEPKAALYRIGMAFVLDKGAQFSRNMGLPPLLPTPANLVQPRELTRYWQTKASDFYLQAYDLAVVSELASKTQPIGGLRKMISYEAGRGYVRLIRKLRLEKEKVEILGKIRDSLKNLEAIPRGAVTPILFPGREQGAVRSFRDLLGEGSVYFDLDSDGENERWPWVHPQTSILVWLPKGSSVTSGRQLFGTTTFGMFWRNGYEPLNSLDDNRDGWLMGDELLGLAVWTDRNVDGVSTLSELSSLKERGVAGVAVFPTGQDGLVYQHLSGILLEDGSFLPTFDWVTTPLPERWASRHP